MHYKYSKSDRAATNLPGTSLDELVTECFVSFDFACLLILTPTTTTPIMMRTRATTPTDTPIARVLLATARVSLASSLRR